MMYTTPDTEEVAKKKKETSPGTRDNEMPTHVDLYTEAALSKLKSFDQTRDGGKRPFLLYLSYQVCAPHPPITPTLYSLALSLSAYILFSFLFESCVQAVQKPLLFLTLFLTTLCMFYMY